MRLKRNNRHQKPETNGILPSSIRLYGYIPEKFKDLLHAKYSKKDLDNISRFLLIVSSGGKKEFDGEKRLHSNQLKMLFDNKYLSYLWELNELGIINWHKQEHEFSSLSNPKSMNSFSIPKGITFKQVRITTDLGIRRANALIISKDDDEVLRKARKCLQSTIIDSSLHKDSSFFLKQGIYLPTRDVFGRRIHSFITSLENKETKTRSLVRYIRKRDRKVVEVDIKASHPFLFIRLIQDPKPFIKILGEEYDPILSLFELVPEPEKKWWCGMYEGDFYDNLASLFDDAELKVYAGNWIFHVWARLIKLGNTIPKTKRDFAKTAFMLALNGADNYLIKLIEEKAAFTAMILRLISIASLSFLKKELNEDHSYRKTYFPYKNMAVILQRSESFLMQKAYVRDNTWGHLIHDSILCTEDTSVTVEKNILAVYQQYLGATPKLKIG